MELIDTHCHLDCSAFDQDRDQVLADARIRGVGGIVVPGVLRTGWPALLDLCAAHRDLYPAPGLHPAYVDQHRDADLTELERLIAERRPVAIGEIGLDWFIEGIDRERQQQLFEAQLVIARDANLPVILHVRKAHDQVLATLRRIRVSKGIAHAYNGSLDQARRYIDLGFRLGFGGTLTYERSRKIRALARDLPIEAIVLETDAPDLTPAAHHGERNSPAYLMFNLAALAEVRGENPLLLADRTARNAREALDLHNWTWTAARDA